MVPVRSRTLIAILAVLLAFAAAGAAARIHDEGTTPGEDLAAFRRGDYATAYRLTLPNAMSGHAVAQHNLGLIYENGYGRPRDYVQAAYWYRQAAAQGFPNAASDLARMYGLGLGVPRDNVQSYVWFTRAASYAANAADRTAILASRSAVAARMTSAELLAARRIAGAVAVRR